MKNIKLIAFYLLHFIVALSISHISMADDTEIYLNNDAVDASGVRPNVLFVLDTSSSMNTEVGNTGLSRLEHMKEALRIIINQSNNVNMGLVRFHRIGGTVLYPVRNINEAVEVVDQGGNAVGASDLVIQLRQGGDDAEEDISTGEVDILSDRLELTHVDGASATSVDLSIPVAQQNDDAEEESDGNMYRGSSDLEFMADGSDLQKIGIRFQSVDIPQGAIITSAKIRFYLDNTRNEGAIDIKIVGHKTANSPEFPDSDYDITHRINNNPTDASVIWTPPATSLDVGDDFYADGLSTIAQEIVNQSGWVSGNAMTFLFQRESGDGAHEVESYSDSSKRPRLFISYSLSGGDPVAQKVGLRFNTVMIPKGATITSAVIEFEAASAQSATTNLILNGEAIDHSPAFIAADNNISQRTLTSATVPWENVESWSVGERYLSPSVISIIQELVNRDGWCGGQALSFVVSGTANSLRMAQSYEGDPGAAPILRVSYDPDTIPDDTCIDIEVQASISNGSDDVEESSNGNIDLTSSDLELVHDGSDQTIGLRFRNVFIPHGSTVRSAYLVFSDDVTEPESGAVSLTIKGENVDDSAAFNSVVANVSDRVTTGNVSWSPGAWGAASDWYSSPEVTSIVQTIVNRGGWTSGNSMSFIITGSGSGKRVANSFDGEAGMATRLVVVVAGGTGDETADVPVQTVRNKLLEIVDNLQYKSSTPIPESLYEAALYYRGDDVYFGRTRGRGHDGNAPNANDSRSQHTRVSHPLSWSGTGTIVRPDGCTVSNPNTTACIGESISGEATYISPIEQTCQANYQIFLSDGDGGYYDDGENLMNTMMSGTPFAGCHGGNACSIALTGFLHSVDQSAILDEVQTITTYTIGFNSAGSPDFLRAIAAAGGGSFQTASTAGELAEVFQTILSEVLDSTSSFSAPTVSVNAFNKLFHDDDIYFSTFLPATTVRWGGNLKKYKAYDVTCTFDDEGILQSCTDEEGDAVTDVNLQCAYYNKAISNCSSIVDANTDPATDATGQFVETSQSFWTDNGVNDGHDVQLGGTGAEISYVRKVYIENANSFTRLTEDVATFGDGDYSASLRALLDAGDSLSDNAYQNLANWILGEDILDEDEDTTTTDRWAFSDALHSQPLVITYGKETDGDSIKKIFIGTNDGMLHMINAESGAEEWAFMPEAMTAMQIAIMNNTNGDHRSGVDGNIRSLIIDNNQNGKIEPENVAGKRDKVYIFFGMRRGGRDLYALDVTPSVTQTNALAVNGITPSLLWKIQGGTTAGFERLGQTWSTPQLTQVWYDGSKKTVVMFAGGYHEAMDTADGYTRDAAGYGDAVYMVDALTGALLWRGDETGIAVGSESVTAFADMDYPIPSDLAILDTNGDGAANRVYVGDTGGQVWRIDFKNANGGMAGSGARLAHISAPDDNGDLADADKRKFFYAPDVSLIKDFQFSDKAAAYDVLIMVSGDRSAPNSDVVHNRIYMFRDYVISGTIYDESHLTAPADGDPEYRRFVDSLTEDDLYNATLNTIQNEDGSLDADEVTDLRAKDGWYINLHDGTTDDGIDEDWVGEKGLSEPAILSGFVILTTYLPAGEAVENNDDICASPIEGNGRVYAMSLLTGKAVFSSWEDDVDTYERGDRVYNRSLTGIPSSPVIRMTKKGPQILIGGGGGILEIDANISLPIVRSSWKEL